MNRLWVIGALVATAITAATAGSASTRERRHYQRSETGRYFAREHQERRHRRVRELCEERDRTASGSTY